MAEIVSSVGFTIICCSKCGIQFGVPEHWRMQRARDHTTFTCPNQHEQHYPGESDLERLRREKEQSALSFQAKLNDANHAALVAQRERDKAIRDKRKVERRIAHGVCPCCNKTFADIANHMITEHKDFRLPGGKERKLLTT